MNHSPEPWKTQPQFGESWKRQPRIIDKDGKAVLYQTYGEGNGMNDMHPPALIGIADNDLDRIVACVNACRGLETQALLDYAQEQEELAKLNGLKDLMEGTAPNA